MNMEVIVSQEKGPSLAQWRGLAVAQTAIGLLAIGVLVGGMMARPEAKRETTYTLRVEYGRFPPPPAPGPTPEVEPIGDTLAP
jgi:hypothetical protein